MPDLRYALRSLLKSPGFTVVAVLVLALGIGANTAIFSVIDAVLLRPMPYPQADRIVRIAGDHPQSFVFFTRGAFEVWPAFQRARSFSAVGAYVTGGISLGGADGYRLRAAAVTPDFFDVIGAKAWIGRTLTVGDVQRSAHIAVIGHKLWQSRFAGDPDVLSRSITLNGQSFLVIGVMPPRIDVPQATDVWIPSRWHGEIREGAAWVSPVVVARLAPGVTMAHALEEVARTPGPSFQAGRVEDSPTPHGLNGRIVPLRNELVVDTTAVLFLVAAGALLVLFVASINTANLLLTRVSAREREYAIRRALGASDRDLAQQVLCENLLLSGLAGAATLPILLWTMDGVRSLVPITLYGASDIALNYRTIIATAGLLLLTAAFFSIPPLWSIGGRHSSLELRGTSVATADPAWRRFRSVLVVGEVAISLILLAGAATVVRTVGSLMAADLGARGENALVIHLDLPRTAYKASERVWQYYDLLESGIRAVPGVREVAVTSALPGAANQIGSGELLVDGEPTPAKYGGVRISATPGYFSAIGVDVLAGRPFAVSDGFFAPKVAIVSESFARIYKMRPAEIVGRTAILDHRRVQIVGVVRDVMLGGPEAAIAPAAYIPLAQQLFAGGPMNVVVRANGDPTALISAIRAAMARVDPNVPLYNIQTFDEIRATFVRDRRFVMTMMSAFGGLAFALAALGLYGVIGYLVQLRTKEIGVRMALGASRSSVRLQVLTTGLSHALGGILVGCALALAASQFFSASFPKLGQLQLSSLGLISLAIAAVAAVATWFPARRATLIDPVQALRFE